MPLPLSVIFFFLPDNHFCIPQNSQSKLSIMETNKLIARLWLDFINKHDIEGLCAITADTWKMHGGLPGLPEGPAGVRKLFASFGPVEQQWKAEDIIAEGDKVVIRATNHCWQESFLGLQSHGIRQVFSAMFIHHIVDGRIQETWRNADDLGRVLQLGARIIPATEESRQPLVSVSDVI
jgi:predicted SnoaL-like aldol condensation-catalyzing enzyme